jgi:hypothetical protein
MNSSSTELPQILTTNSNDLLCPVITPRHGLRRKHSLLYCWEGLFTDPLPSNGRLIVARISFRGNMSTEPLPGNGSIRHSINFSRREIFISYKNYSVCFLFPHKNIMKFWTLKQTFLHSNFPFFERIGWRYILICHVHRMATKISRLESVTVPCFERI